MRMIRMGAIQPNVLPTAPGCDPMKDDYCRDVDAIMERHIVPQLGVNLALLEKAGEAKLDIVTTSEDSTSLYPFMIDTTGASIFPGLAARSAALCEEKVAAIARKYGMYIVACYVKPVGDAIYNTASIFDRSGAIVGAYNKTHLPPNEFWQIAPGDDIPVFQLDFGTVGIQICYDMMFPEVSRVLSLRGAEVVFHPTAGYGWYDSIGEATLRTRANDGSFHLVTAKNYVFNGAGRSSVVDHWGQILADAGFYPDALVFADIDLDALKTQPDWFYPTGMSGEARVRVRHDRERRPELYGTITTPVDDPYGKPSDEDVERIRGAVNRREYRW